MSSEIQIFVCNVDGKSHAFNVDKNEQVDNLMQVLCKEFHIQQDDLWLQFGGKPLQLGKKISEYGIRDMSTIHMALRLRGGVKPGKSMSVSQKGPIQLKELPGLITLTDDPCMISLEQDKDTKRAKMPCGHVISHESMTTYCQSLLDHGKFTFCCPYRGPRNEQCNVTWEYTLVRHVACLTVQEQQEFEKHLHENYAKKVMNMQQCPGCKTYCFKPDDIKDKQIVRCPLCTAKKQSGYDFCWVCRTVTDGSTTKCPNNLCDGRDPRLHIIKMAGKKKIGEVSNVPSIRLCVGCGITIEHKKGCKQMTCNSCNQKFCFICLKPAVKGDYQCGAWNTLCSPAPIQTQVPGTQYNQDCGERKLR